MPEGPGGNRFRSALRQLLYGGEDTKRAEIGGAMARGSRALVDFLGSLSRDVVDDPVGAYTDAWEGGVAGVGQTGLRYAGLMGAPVEGAQEALRSRTPSSPSGQAGSLLGSLGGEMTPVGDVAAALDAKEAFGEGNIPMGLLNMAGILPLVPGMGPLLKRAEDLVAGSGHGANRAMNRGSEEMVTLHHYGEKADQVGELDPAYHGTGQAGREMERKRDYPEEYQDRIHFYTPEAQVSNRFKGLPRVEVRVPRRLMADEGMYQQYLKRARESLPPEDRLDMSLAANRAEQLLTKDGYEGWISDRGIAVKFTKTPVPLQDFRVQNILDLHKANNGSTTNPVTGENFAGQKAYAVSMFKDRERVLRGHPTEADLRKYIEENWDLLGQEGHTLGTWFNPEDGKTYLDVSRTVKNRKEAMRIARENDQLAIFDLKNFKDIKATDRGVEVAKRQARRRMERALSTPQGRENVIKEIERGLIPEELEEFRGLRGPDKERTIRNYLMAPSPSDFSDVILAGSRARGWYNGSARSIFETFGADAPRFAALMAAQSPRKSVAENLNLSLKTWKRWNDAGRPMSNIPRNVNAEALGTNHNNVIRALTATEDRLRDLDQTDLLSGPKVDPFYQNLLGDTQRIVNDTWQAQMYGTEGGGVGAVGRKLAQNAMVRNASRLASRRAGLPRPLYPMEAQETGWTFGRGLGMSANGRGHQGALDTWLENPDAPQAGGFSMEERMNDNAAIGVLMADPKNKAILESLGLKLPEAIPPTGFDVPEGAIRPQGLRNIARRMDAVKMDDPFYSIAGLLGGSAATRGLLQREEEPPKPWRAPGLLGGGG